MNPGDQRRAQLLTRLQKNARLSVAELAAHYRVSDETIRRDLRELEDRGLLRRVHGGAVAPSLFEGRSHLDRTKIQRGAKERIAAKALSFVRSGMSIFVSYGTTTELFGQRLGSLDKLTVMTNSIPLAMQLAANTPHRVILTGGDLEPGDRAVMGRAAEDMVRHHVFDLGVMSTRAIDPVHGMMEYRESDAQIIRAVADQSKQTLLLADHSKFGQQAFVKTCGFSAIDVLVTDRAPDPEFAEPLAQAGVQVVY